MTPNTSFKGTRLGEAFLGHGFHQRRGVVPAPPLACPLILTLGLLGVKVNIIKMNPPLIFRSIGSSVFAVAAVFALVKTQGTLSLSELIVVALVGSILATCIGSFARAPRQFLRAIYERVRYAFLVPICALLLVGLLVFKVCFLGFKLLLGATLKLTLGILYLISPIDLMPDLIPILGLIDDIVVLISIAVWIASAGISENIRTSIKIHRPTTHFP